MGNYEKAESTRDLRAILARGLVQCAAVVGALTISSVLSAANASTIALSLYSTGRGQHWRRLNWRRGRSSLLLVVENGNANAVVINTPAATYFPNNATSTWVWQSADAQPRNVTRTFTTTFDLTGYDPSTVVISGSWGTDNQGLEIDLNGNNTGVPGLLGVVVANFASFNNLFDQHRLCEWYQYPCIRDRRQRRHQRRLPGRTFRDCLAGYTSSSSSPALCLRPRRVGSARLAQEAEGCKQPLVMHIRVVAGKYRRVGGLSVCADVLRCVFCCDWSVDVLLLADFVEEVCK